MGSFLRSRYYATGKESYLRRSITILRKPPPDRILSPDTLARHTRFTLKGSLACSLSLRFHISPRLADLDDAVKWLVAALEHLPTNHPTRASFLVHIGDCYSCQFDQTGDKDLLKQAIECLEDARVICTPPDPMYPFLLRITGDAHAKMARFLGKATMTSEAIHILESAAAAHPKSHPDCSTIHGHIGQAYSTRFLLHHESSDLEDAMTAFRLSFSSHQRHTYETPAIYGAYGNLLLALLYRDNHHDRGEFIQAYRSSLENMTQGTYLWTKTVTALANALQRRFILYGFEEDMQESLKYYRWALDVPPNSAGSEADFDRFILNSASRHGVVGDTRRRMLEKAVDLHLAALRHTPLETVNALGIKVRDLLRSLNDIVDKAHVTLPHRLEVASVHAALSRRFMSLMENQIESEAAVMESYRKALDLLELLVALRPTVETQHASIKEQSGFVLSAASFCLDMLNPRAAVEVLEQGRGLLFSEMRGFRASLEVLEESDKTLAEAFTKTSGELERLIMSSRFQYAGGSTMDIWMRRSLDKILDQKQALQMEFESITIRIRAIPGLQNFLRARPFEDLRKAADEGPVIVVNHDKHRCDAIILHKDYPDPFVLELHPGFYEEVRTLDAELRDARQHIRSSPKLYNSVLRHVLHVLWESLVERVVDKLERLGVPKKSRIWWCPTSVLANLPLHAAGPIPGGATLRYLPDVYVSSYTPTLTALIDARAKPLTNGALNRLVVGQHGSSILPKANDEIRHVVDLLPKELEINVLSGETLSRDSVLERLNTCHWAHLACHGRLKAGNPFRSFFELNDGEHLTLLDLVQTRLPNAQFAFLSACNSAQQSPGSASEEVLHLASAMQFSGFGSVVGTMWAMSDEDGPTLSRYFYTAILRRDVAEEERYRSAAAALRAATLRMRNRDCVGLERWVNYVHIGA
ncbi:CHAT domain-containing protein [Cristinia sonorae]|uniref:CHAT domain-containing protein n=1 Tax=Cristinia sonorae TaxID=1940300 RepID=A0A8K0XP76_9AGAR|nr:CHAT domain-containing protein [Cristinia sonorae]